jgi:hypothetical protein
MSSEIALSTDLNTVTAEIRSYQNIGGQAVFEIGRRLKWVKEHDLAHGEYGKWLGSMNIDATFARRAVKISEEFSSQATLPDLGASALYLIATMPPDERTKPHLTDDGEIKTPEEMSVRQLQTLKTQLKERDATITNLFAENAQLKAREPEVIEKQVEVKPDDYDATKASEQKLLKEVDYLKRRNENLERDLEDLQAQRAKYEKDSAEYQELTKRMDELRGKVDTLNRRQAAAVDMVDLKGKIADMLNRIAPQLYVIDFSQFNYNDPAMQTLRSAVDHVQHWVDDMYSTMPANIDEGVIINDNQ